MVNINVIESRTKVDTVLNWKKKKKDTLRYIIYIIYTIRKTRHDRENVESWDGNTHFRRYPLFTYSYDIKLF